jgi:hypothetical protein
MHPGPYERHHIIPECFYAVRKRKGPSGWLLGNANDEINLVYLTPKEHFVCHHLLTKMVEGKQKSKMHLALLTMARSSKTNNRYKINAKTYDKIRKDAANANSGTNNGMWGKKRTVEECRKISDGIAQSEKAGARSYILTQEHKNKISESKKNIPRPQHVIDAMMAGRKKVSFDNNSGKKWYNNSVTSFLSLDCPEGCSPGRLPY